MAVQDVPAKRGRSITPILEIEASPAHEFLMTLRLIAQDKDTLEQPYEVGDQWFEMMREKSVNPRVFWMIPETRSKPIPVSTCRAGNGEKVPSGLALN